MKNDRQWASLIGFCFLAVLASALAFAVLITAASVLFGNYAMAADDNGINALPRGARSATETDGATVPASPISETKFTGMISDSICGARHMRNSGLTATECVRACVRRGATYILIGENRRYTLIGDEQAISKLAGERVSVTGNLQQDAIVVLSITPSL